MDPFFADGILDSNFHSGSLSAEIHNEIAPIIKGVDDLGLRTLVAERLLNKDVTSRFHGKGKGKGKGGQSKTQEKKAHKSFHANLQAKKDREPKLIIVSVAVNMALPEHREAFLKIQNHEDILQVTPEYHEKVAEGYSRTFRLDLKDQTRKKCSISETKSRMISLRHF